jgi:hypothetical protein
MSPSSGWTEHPPPNSFVLPELKIVYISVTKAACTSLRWMIADLAGEDLDSFPRSLSAHQTRLMTIHGGRDRRCPKVPRLSDLRQRDLSVITPDEGWFVFAVVRDPWSRLWSAWQSKFLVRHAKYVRHYQDRPWFPRVPDDAAEVVRDWRRFVDERPWQVDQRLRQDHHFTPQARAVRPRQLPYTKIYDLTDMASLAADLGAHLATQGRSHELYLPRSNETPLAITAEVLADGVADRVRELYAADFRAFGDRWDLGGLRLAPDGWTQDAVRHVAFQTQANERIGDLSVRAKRLHRELARTRQPKLLPIETVERRARSSRKVVRLVRKVRRYRRRLQVATRTQLRPQPHERRRDLSTGGVDGVA